MASVDSGNNEYGNEPGLDINADTIANLLVEVRDCLAAAYVTLAKHDPRSEEESHVGKTIARINWFLGQLKVHRG